MKLRPYQDCGKTDILKSFVDNDIVMFVLATGGGKTVTFVEIIREYYERGERVMLIAHREELIEQAWQTINRAGMLAGIIKSGYPNRYELPIQVCSIQTLIRRKKLPSTDLIVIDEAHHVTDDNSYGKILRLYPESKVLMVTATPYRLSGDSFLNVFPGKETRLIVNSTLKSLIEDGWLVPIRYCVGSIPDMSGVPIIRGEYEEEGAAKIMELAPLVESYLEHCKGMKGICYCVSVAHSKYVTNQYNEAGIIAVHLDAESTDEYRAQVLQDFRDGKVHVVCNVGILTEGTDFPNCEFIQLARPTKSLSMYLQMVGRVTRTLPGLVDDLPYYEDRKRAIIESGKPAGIVLDNAGCWIDHGFPDDERDWNHYFSGWTKPKKLEDPAIIEIPIYVIEDPVTGAKRSTKNISEVAGMVLIEVTKEIKERLREPLEIAEFENLYRFAMKKDSHFKKPGFFAYYEMIKWCHNRGIDVSESLWRHMKKRLVDDIEEEIDKYLDQCRILGFNVIPSINAHVSDIRKRGVPSFFLRKEKELMQKRNPVAVQ